MKIYDNNLKAHIETPIYVKEFIKDIMKVYDDYGLSISHEDIGGNFKIERLKKENIDKLNLESLILDI